MKKMVLIVVGIAVVLVLAVIGFFWYMMGRPLYEPGMVRSEKALRAPLAPPRQSMEGDFWLVENDIKLHRYSVGNGRNVLVVHGGPGYPMSEPMQGLQPLTTQYKFHYYDQRGCGQSSRPFDRLSSRNFLDNVTSLDKTLGLGAQIADIERIRRILGEDSLIIVGHSFGGFLASMYAVEFPGRVKGLILVAPANLLVMPPDDGGLFEEIKGRLPESMKAEYTEFLKSYFDYGGIFSKSEADLASLNAKIAKYYWAASGSAAASSQAREIKDAGGWMVQAMYFSMGRRHDYRKSLAAVKAPVLVIHGENDLQPEKASRSCAAAFSNSRFHLIKNAGHFSFNEQPAEFATVTGEFLNALK